MSDKHREKIKIQNKFGLHARPAAIFVEKASKFSSEIFVKKEDMEVNGKSIMGIMMLAAGPGTLLTITAQGDDCKDAVSDLVKLIKDKFYEE